VKPRDRIFRAYDVRGVYGVDLDEEAAEVIGKAFGTFLGPGKVVAVAHDVRLSSEPLERGIAEGLMSAGLHVRRVGLVPSPTAYFVIAHHGLDGGVVVTASHNPPEWNGFKLCREKAILCGFGMGMEEIREIALGERFAEAARGASEDWRERVLREYESLLLERAGPVEGFRVLVDAGNGSCAQFADRILRRAGLRVEAINNSPDGTFPSRPPEPTEENLAETRRVVLSGGYDFGVAYDGDGDRSVFIDDKSRVVEGDRVLALFVRHLARPGDRIVYEVSCSKIVEEAIRERGCVPVMTRVGHSFILEKMISEEAAFGGEIASHLYFGEFYGLDDGVFACLKVAELLSKTGMRLSELTDSLPRYVMRRRVYSVEDELKFTVVDRLKEEFRERGFSITTIDGVRVDLEDGWFIVRASNTLPQVKATVEAADEETLGRLGGMVESSVSRVVEELRRAGKA